jgi:hypothetical protein
MPRYIDADALLKHEIEADRMGAMLVVGKGYILSAPEVNAVTVVRCKECKSHGTLKSGELFCGKIKTGIYGDYHTVKADDYCSYGKKMEEAK